MAVTQILRKQKWEQVHQNLNCAFEREIHLMREVLAHLHQEEFALLKTNLDMWTKERNRLSDVILALRKQRFLRMIATEELTKCAVELKKNELLSHNEELSCEILSKLDQLFALLDRINLQNCRNNYLFEQKHQKKKMPLSCHYPHPLHRTRRKKTHVATYTQEI